VRCQREGAEAVDYFEVQLEYENLKVKLCARSLVCEPSPRFVLYGTAGSYVKFGLDPQEEALKHGGTPAQPNWGTETEGAWGTCTRCEDGPTRHKYPTLPGRYQSYYDNVFGAIRGREELAVKPEQAGEVIRMIELAIESSKERRVIPLL
jgi:predicted dehydrogenase